MSICHPYIIIKQIITDLWPSCCSVLLHRKEASWSRSCACSYTPVVPTGDSQLTRLVWKYGYVVVRRALSSSRARKLHYYTQQPLDPISSASAQNNYVPSGEHCMFLHATHRSIKTTVKSINEHVEIVYVETSHLLLCNSSWQLHLVRNLSCQLCFHYT